MDFLIYSISLMFGVGLLCFFWLFASFSKYAAGRETEKPRRNHRFAHMLHAEGIDSVGGGRVVRTKGVTYQLTKDECDVFFASLPGSILQLLRNSGTANVLYLGRAKGDNPSVYPIFNIVCLGDGGPVIDTTSFSPSALSVREIVCKYDLITENT